MASRGLTNSLDGQIPAQSRAAPDWPESLDQPPIGVPPAAIALNLFERRTRIRQGGSSIQLRNGPAQVTKRASQLRDLRGETVLDNVQPVDFSGLCADCRPERCARPMFAAWRAACPQQAAALSQDPIDGPVADRWRYGELPSLECRIAYLEAQAVLEDELDNMLAREPSPQWT